MAKTIVQMFQETKGKILSLVYPKRCPVCDEILNPEEGEIHPFCKSKLVYVSEPACVRCGGPIEDMSRELCYDCASYFQSINYSQEQFVSDFHHITNHKISKALDFQGKAIFLYKGAIKESLYRLKYANKREYACFFAKEAVKLYGTWIKQNQIELIIPVPMYAKKQRKRGYNQAESFARELSILTQIPIETHWIERVKDTIPQKTLSKQERKNNLKSAFQTRKSIVQYKKRILVVDDIYTTGSTMEAVAACLQEAGVREIFILNIATGTS